MDYKRLFDGLCKNWQFVTAGMVLIGAAVWSHAFRDAFLESVLQKSALFKQWAAAYYDDGEGEEEQKTAEN